MFFLKNEGVLFPSVIATEDLAGLHGMLMGQTLCCDLTVQAGPSLRAWTSHSRPGRLTALKVETAYPGPQGPSRT